KARALPPKSRHRIGLPRSRSSNSSAARSIAAIMATARPILNSESRRYPQSEQRPADGATQQALEDSYRGFIERTARWHTRKQAAAAATVAIPHPSALA